MDQHRAGPADGEAHRSQRPVWLGEDGRGWDHVRVHLALIRDTRTDAVDVAVYLALAAHAETGTGECFPAADTIAGYWAMHERTVRRHIARLEAFGWIAIERRPGAASRYRLLPPPARTPGTESGVPRAQSPTNESHRTRTTELELSLDPVAAERVSAAGLAAPSFDDLWRVYPRKVGKRTARAAWARAVTRAAPATILAGARRLRDDPNRPEDRYVPHPTTWLNRDGWADAPDPPRAAGARASRDLRETWAAAGDSGDLAPVNLNGATDGF